MRKIDLIHEHRVMSSVMERIKLLNQGTTVYENNIFDSPNLCYYTETQFHISNSEYYPNITF